MESIQIVQKQDFTNKVIGNKVFMLINKDIGSQDESTDSISGSAFAAEMYAWKSQGKDITVKINCLGGSVYHGWSMVDSIIETGASTENVGFAYSMGGVCLMVGKYRTAYDFSRTMIHAPRGGNNSKGLEEVKNQFRDLLKSHTKFTETEINEMIDSGKDYFFNAKEMLAKGIIDRIVTTGKSDPIGLSSQQMHTYYNSYIDQDQNKNTEMEILAKIFGGKTESDNLVSAVQMKAENETLKAAKAHSDSEIVALKSKLQELELEKGKIEAKQKAEDLIDNAIKADKLQNVSLENKAKLVESATVNYDATKIMIDSMKAQKTVSAAASISTEKSKDKTYEWLAKNDPEQLNVIAEQDPELFAKLSSEYYQSQKN